MHVRALQTIRHKKQKHLLVTQNKKFRNFSQNLFFQNMLIFNTRSNFWHKIKILWNNSFGRKFEISAPVPPAEIFAFYVGVFGGHEHACRPTISYQIGTNRIPMMRTIDLKGQNRVLSYPGVRISRKYWTHEKQVKKTFFGAAFW